MRFPEITLRLPDWVEDLVDTERVYANVEDRMRLASSPDRASAWDRRTFRGRSLRPGDGQAARPRCQPGRYCQLLRRSCGDSCDYSGPTTRREFRPRHR